MIHAFEPFATCWRSNPDYDRADAQNEDEQLVARNYLLAEAWRGERPLDEALDCLRDQGMDVDLYLHACIENVDFVLKNKIHLTDSDFLIPSSDIAIAQEL